MHTQPSSLAVAVTFETKSHFTGVFSPKSLATYFPLPSGNRIKTSLKKCFQETTYCHTRSVHIYNLDLVSMAAGHLLRPAQGAWSWESSSKGLVHSWLCHKGNFWHASKGKPPYWWKEWSHDKWRIIYKGTTVMGNLNTAFKTWRFVTRQRPQSIIKTNR